PLLCSGTGSVPVPAPSLAAGLASSPVGHAGHDPFDDRVESLRIERMSAVDTKLGDEIAGDPGHDLVCIPRVLVRGARYDHRRPRCDGCKHIVRVDLASESWHRLVQGEPGFLPAARFEAAHGPADACEPASRIHCGVVEGRVAAIRVSRHSHEPLVYARDPMKDAQGALGVIEA